MTVMFNFPLLYVVSPKAISDVTWHVHQLATEQTN